MRRLMGPVPALFLSRCGRRCRGSCSGCGLVSRHQARVPRPCRTIPVVDFVHSACLAAAVAPAAVNALLWKCSRYCRWNFSRSLSFVFACSTRLCSLSVLLTSQFFTPQSMKAAISPVSASPDSARVLAKVAATARKTLSNLVSALCYRVHSWIVTLPQTHRAVTPLRSTRYRW